MSYRINLVEDEKHLNDVLSTYLKQEGWQVTSFYTGKEAQQALQSSPDLWILDIMLPDIDGYQLLQECKEFNPDVPIIFISARDADLDRIIGLELGSDDYLPKPFLPRELVIRTKKLLDRTYGRSSSQTTEQIVELPPYTIEVSKRVVYKEGSPVNLTSKEFDLLLLFVQNPKHAFSREHILQHVWGQDYFGSDRVVDDLVRRLRKKMEELRLETIYGYGYRMVEA
ncbi:response regulator transcription factor [Bacillus horti]|uniref:Two-component system response regulator CssR n=1 Tax=Caldalkalibacillus horti TaxID=77523 RepID=A0ABT9VTC3_9BACI|nr:response regulator transcription factor [Bacillus horti]MDQ0164102.1 two-component system response regulator CssR [Bacillus horti]